jgi:apolipoprotein N-acyltransferase
MKFIGYFLILPPAALMLLFLCYQLFFSSSNHTIDAIESLNFLIPWAIISCCLFIIQKKDRLFFIALCISLLAVVFFYGIDKFNVQVEYEKWLERGMPSAFTIKAVPYEGNAEERLKKIQDLERREEEIRKSKEELQFRSNR